MGGTREGAADAEWMGGKWVWGEERERGIAP